MSVDIAPGVKISAYALIVDINEFSPIVRTCETGSVVQDIRDILVGPISAIESCGGEIVAIMGDAFLGIIQGDDDLLEACYCIAKSLDQTCEWISNAQQGCSSAWSHMPGGPSLKVSAEYGPIEISSIKTRFLGEQVFLIGNTINYASRIGHFGEGNRCVLGHMAGRRIAEKIAPTYLEGPFSDILPGKESEGNYWYSFLKLDDIWREGSRVPGEDSYWG